jgi:hypothetical protein
MLYGPGRRPRNQNRQSAPIPKRRRRAQVRHGRRLAPWRAITGAQFYLAHVASEAGVTLQEAADSHGASATYLQAALKVVRTNDERLVKRVVHDQVPLLAAEQIALARTQLIQGCKAASPEDREALFRATGLTSDLGKLLRVSTPEERTKAARDFGHVDKIWDDMIEPQIK